MNKSISGANKSTSEANILHDYRLQSNHGYCLRSKNANSLQSNHDYRLQNKNANSLQSKNANKLTCIIPKNNYTPITTTQYRNYEPDINFGFTNQKQYYKKHKVSTNFLSDYLPKTINSILDNLTIVLPNTMESTEKIPKHFTWCECHINKSKKNIPIQNICHCKK